MIAALMVLATSSNVLAEGSFADVSLLGSHVNGAGFKLYDKPLTQSRIGHEFENGIGGSVWGSLPFESIGKNQGTETDLRMWWHDGAIILGVGYFFISPDGKRFYDNDVWQINADVSKDIKLNEIFTISPGLRAEYDMPVKGRYSSQTTGLYLFYRNILTAKLDKSWQASLAVTFEGDLGGYGAQKALITMASPGFSYKVNQNLSVNAGIDMYFPVTWQTGDPRGNFYVPKVGISYKW